MSRIAALGPMRLSGRIMRRVGWRRPLRRQAPMKIPQPPWANAATSHMILPAGARPGNQQARRGATRPLSISRPCVRSDVRRLTTKDRKSHKGTRIAAVRTAARRLMSPHSFPLVRMAGFPPNNSLYSPDQAYRLSDAEPFGERSLVVASDDQWRYVPVRRFVLFVERSVSSSVQSAAFEPNGPALWAAVNSKAVLERRAEGRPSLAGLFCQMRRRHHD